MRDQIEAAQADTEAAEVVAEALHEEVSELTADVQALRRKLDGKSKVEFDRLRNDPALGPSLTELLGKKGEEY